MGQQIVFAYEARERLRVAALGTSGHMLRNYLPVLPFLPAEYVAQWDPDVDRARAFARLFGAGDAAYDDLDALLREREPQAVWIGTDELEGDGRPIQARLVAHCLQAGIHVFCDKPVAASAQEARRLIQERERAGRTVGVGIKTMFYPTHERIRQLIDDPAAEFGSLVSLALRYPLHTPARGGLPPTDAAVRACLGHVWHPIGAALRIGGPLQSVQLLQDRGGRNGVAVATFRSGAVGALHFPRTKSGASPLERLEVVGEGADAIVDNAVRLTYYRKTSPGPYGRTIDPLTPLGEAPAVWQPEFSLGQLYNDHNFMQGYGQSLLHFCAAALAGRPTTVGTLEDALEVLKAHEAFCAGPGRAVEFADG